MEPIQQTYLASYAHEPRRGSGERTRTALRRLVRAELQVIACFTAGMERIADEELRADLGRICADLERHVLELSEIMRLLGERPPGMRLDLRGRVLRRWTSLAARRGDGAVIHALRARVRRLDRRYDRALAWDLPLEAGANLLTNQLDLRRHRLQLRNAQLQGA